MALEDTLDPFDVITVVVPGSIVVITWVAILAPERLTDLFTNVGNILLIVFLSYISGQTIVLISGVLAGQLRLIFGSSLGSLEFLFHSPYEPTPVFIQQFKIGKDHTKDSKIVLGFLNRLMPKDMDIYFQSQKFRRKVRDRYGVSTLLGAKRERINTLYQLILVDLDSELSPATRRLQIRKEFYRYMATSLFLSGFFFTIHLIIYQLNPNQNFIMNIDDMSYNDFVFIMFLLELAIFYSFFIFKAASMRDHLLFDQFLIAELISQDDRD